MTDLNEILKPVESSMFSRAGYDDSLWELIFEFKSTLEIRAYKDVSPDTAEEALTAESIGKWWNGNVRGNPAWIYDVVQPGQAAKATPKQEAKKQAASVEGMGITEDDIRAIDPTYHVGTDTAVGEDKTHVVHMTNMAHWPEGFMEGEVVGEQKPEPGTYGAIERQKSLPAQPPAVEGQKPEIMPAWTAPESAGEALDLLSERESEIDAIIAQNKQTSETALAIRVTDTPSRLSASKALDALVEKKDKTTNLLEPFRKQLYDAYTYAADKKKAGVDPIEAGVKHVKAQIIAYDSAQERIRQDAIRKAREEAEARARELQEQERQRITLADVQDSLDAGDHEKAETLFSKPVDVPLPYVAPEYIAPSAPKVEGQSTSSKWKVAEDLIDTEELYLASIMELLRAVKDDKIELRLAAGYLKWDLVSLNKLAGALKTAFYVPGLTAGPVGSISVRRKK